MSHLRELLSQTVQNTAEEFRNKIDEKKCTGTCQWVQVTLHVCNIVNVQLLSLISDFRFFRLVNFFQMNLTLYVAKMSNKWLLSQLFKYISCNYLNADVDTWQYVSWTPITYRLEYQA